MSMNRVVRQINGCPGHCSSYLCPAATTQSWRRTRKVATALRAAADVVSNTKSININQDQDTRKHGAQRRSLGVGHLDARMRERRVPARESDDDGLVKVNANDAEVSDKEMSRREKISRANKGKVPWNKGKNMSEEVKAKISQKTYEAMQRPDVRARMKKANANRAPHSEEVRKRIREVLRKRADEARKVITVQTDQILAGMKESDDAREREIATNVSNAHEIIGKLAWRLLHRDFELMYEKWEHNTDGFRDAIVLRFDELGRRKTTRKKKLVSVRAGKKVDTTGQAREKIMQAEEKLQSVEEALKKLQSMKTTYKDDPESLSIVLQKEVQTTDMLKKLREQVELLHKAMELPPSIDATTSSGQSENSNVSVLDSKWDKDAESSTLTQVPWNKGVL